MAVHLASGEPLSLVLVQRLRACSVAASRRLGKALSSSPVSGWHSDM
jgi:hypothetical protein